MPKLFKKCAYCHQQTNNPKFCSQKCYLDWTSEFNIKQMKTKKCGCGELICKSKDLCSKCSSLNKEESICKKHNILRENRHCFKCGKTKEAKNRLKKKQKMFELLGGKCNGCGITNVNVINFHHVNPLTKSFNIQKGLNFQWDKLIPEINKCIPVCANCHLLHHAENFKLSEHNLNSIKLTAELVRELYGKRTKIAEARIKAAGL